ncbi:response regulator [candidate division KSB1 bacterium]|nr:response regulator [candidate division KSB1 bacterium]
MLRILIIEDDKNTLQGLLELLRHEEFIVSGAENGKKARHIFANEAFDVVLCDYRLPDTNGLLLCNDFLMAQPDLQVMLFTAYNISDISKKAERVGIRRIFAKPIVLDMLFDELAEIKLIKQKIEYLSLS